MSLLAWPTRLVVLAAVVMSLLAATGCGSTGGSMLDSAAPGATGDSDEGGSSEGSDVATVADGTDDTDDDTDADTDGTDGANQGTAGFEVAPSVGQVTVTGAEPETTLELVTDAESTLVDSGDVDELGNLIFRLVDPAGGPYRIVTTLAEGDGLSSDTFSVTAPDEHRPADFYAAQTLDPGLNYIETRDGTLLAAMVRLPGPPEDGPYPTLVEYSGYDPANPDSPQPGTLVGTSLGYATVGVNMRGSGCSGGAFDYFEELQSTDGYDMIEAIAAQPWVQDNEVGMIGISYPGISQLFVAATNPPGLAAITPVAVVEDTYRSVLYPGGIYNDGFAKEWGEERQEQTAAYGQEWVTTQVDERGDTVCEANQLLRSQNVDLGASARASDFYLPEVSDRLSPRTFVDRIDVPVFLAGSWQDEQTGPRFATMVDRFTRAPIVRSHFQNGAHADSFGPVIIQRLAEFLDLYVAKKVPEVPEGARLTAPVLFADAFGVSGVQLPADRFTDQANHADALAAYEAEPPVLVLVENGATAAAPGVPTPRAQVQFAQWPPSRSSSREWFLGANGTLLDSLAVDASVDSYTADGGEGERVTPDAEDTAAFTDLQWGPLTDGGALAFQSDEFAEPTMIAGSGRVDLWVSSTVDEADIEITLTEVRGDGTEQLIQNGWLRASHRKLDPSVGADDLAVQTHAEADFEPLIPDDVTELSIEVFPVAHVLHPGSRLRLIIDTPGGNRAEWKFEVDSEIDGSSVSVYHGASTPARLLLPLVTGLDVPTGLPPCVGLRSQPCRQLQPAVNGG